MPGSRGSTGLTLAMYFGERGRREAAGVRRNADTITLAGIKTASLFTCPSDSEKELTEQIRSANRQLLTCGIRLLPPRCQNGHALIYMYRPKRLERDLASRKAELILARAHYPAGNPQRRLAELSLRLRRSREFPHEIGLFLGYPPDDVEGFIKNRARAFKCPGYWKVYGDEEKRRRSSALFPLARHVIAGATYTE